MSTRSYIRAGARALGFIVGSGIAVHASAAVSQIPPEDKAAIQKTMAAYESALNASSTEQVLPLYTDDGVFMAPGSQSNVGISAVKTAYTNVFKAITLKVKFTIAEIVEMSPEWAFVRTNSAGTQTINATGAKTVEANHELFVLNKTSDGMWRIARYSFSGTNPPK